MRAKNLIRAVAVVCFLGGGVASSPSKGPDRAKPLDQMVPNHIVFSPGELPQRTPVRFAGSKPVALRDLGLGGDAIVLAPPPSPSRLAVGEFLEKSKDVEKQTNSGDSALLLPSCRWMKWWNDESLELKSVICSKDRLRGRSPDFEAIRRPGQGPDLCYNVVVSITVDVECESFCYCGPCVSCYFDYQGVTYQTSKPTSEADVTHWIPCNEMNQCAGDS